MLQISCQNMPKNFYCEKCNFVCSKKSNYDKHLLTRKHVNVTNVTKCYRKNAELIVCEMCNKTYKSRMGLWHHKQKCEQMQNQPPKLNSPSIETSPELVPLLLKQLQECHTQIIDLSKNGCTNITNNNNNTTHTNSHNKTFNLNFFLNETCKDAMNITDFVNSLKLNIHDLEQVGELGYAEGISRMFVKGLNDLEVTKRPIHCSDLKREVLHIKDKDAWEKDENKDKLKKAIKDLSNKNFMLMDDWQKENPGCKEYNNRKNDIYLKMMIESLGPADSSAEKRDFGKIIRTIAKNTIIDRENL